MPLLVYIIEVRSFYPETFLAMESLGEADCGELSILPDMRLGMDGSLESLGPILSGDRNSVEVFLPLLRFISLSLFAISLWMEDLG